MQLFRFCFLIGITTGTMASTQRGPSNVVALAGMKTTLSCNTGQGLLGSVDWYFVAAGGTEEIKLSSKSQIFSLAKGFSVNGKIPGESLSINSTELKHAGRYICTSLMQQENGSKTYVAKFSVQVIVLESDPKCSLNASTVKDGDEIEMWCIVTYSGNWNPVMEWREINGTVIADGVFTESANNSLSSTLNFLAGANKHNSSYSCLIYFTAPRNKTIKEELMTDYIHDYNYTWTSPLLQVLYGPKKALVSPLKNYYSDGDEIVCSAEANPIPRFEWKILEDNRTFDGPVFIVRSEMIKDDSILIQCSAINDDIALQAKSHFVKIRTAVGNPSTTKIVMMTVAVLCPALVSVVLIIIQKNIKEWIGKVCRKRRVDEIEADPDIVPLEPNQHVVALEANNSSSCRYADDQRTTGRNAKLMKGENGDVMYEEMNASGFNSIVAPPVGPSLYSASIYASIDHTLRIPPPPTPLPKQRHL